MLVGDPRAAVLVPLVQTATTLPVMLLALPSGVLADLVDRRRLLIATQGAMAAGVGLLASLTAAGLTTPAVLLMLLFVIGCGQALTAPGLAGDPARSRSRRTDSGGGRAGQHEHERRPGDRAGDRRRAGVAVRPDAGLRAQRRVVRRDRVRARSAWRRPAVEQQLPARAGAGGAERGRQVHPQLADRAADPAADGVVHRPGERAVGAAAGDREGPTGVVVVGLRAAARVRSAWVRCSARSCCPGCGPASGRTPC